MIDVDVNDNNQEDYRLDFSYGFRGLKPDLDADVTYPVSRRIVVVGMFRTDGYAQARKIADWTYEYVWFVPKTEVSLSGRSAHLTVKGMTMQGKQAGLSRVYEFKWPVSPTAESEFRVRHFPAKD